MNAAVIDSKDQNRINIFMAAATNMPDYEINSDGYNNLVRVCRLALYNMSPEAQQFACNQFVEETGKEWSYVAQTE